MWSRAWAGTGPYIQASEITSFLDKELEKYNNWEELQSGSNDIIGPLVTDKLNFHQLKKRGVGAGTIQKFLGGNWRNYE